MKTLTPTEARQNLGSWLSRALKGEDIGIVCEGKIVALRPVQVYSEDYVLTEYSLNAEELKRTEKNILQKLKSEKAAAWNGTTKGLRGWNGPQLEALGKKSDWSGIEEIRQRLEELKGGFGKPHLHTGLGLRRLTPQLFEFRISRDIRVVFALLKPNTIRLAMTGNHDEVRAWLKENTWLNSGERREEKL